MYYYTGLFMSAIFNETPLTLTSVVLMDNLFSWIILQNFEKGLFGGQDFLFLNPTEFKI